MQDNIYSWTWLDRQDITHNTTTVGQAEYNDQQGYLHNIAATNIRCEFDGKDI